MIVNDPHINLDKPIQITTIQQYDHILKVLHTLQYKRYSVEGVYPDEFISNEIILYHKKWISLKHPLKLIFDSSLKIVHFYITI